VPVLARGTAVRLTLPSPAAIMTGLVPPRDGVRENGVVRSPRDPTNRALLKEPVSQRRVRRCIVLAHRLRPSKRVSHLDDQIVRDP